MAFFRALLLLFAVIVAVCVAAYLVTGQRRYLQWAGKGFKLAVVDGLLFFAVLLLERMV